MTITAVMLALAFGSAVVADDIRVDLDRHDDPRIRPRVDGAGFAIQVEVAGYLQKLEPTTIRLETQQKGNWGEPRLDVGRYLKTQFDPDHPQIIRVETTLVFDLGAGDRRFLQERDAIQREAQRRAPGKNGAAAKARTEVLLERIAAIREENIKAGADKRGKSTLHCPPLPRQAMNFEKVDVLERLLKEQCSWQAVADVFKATQFQPPDERDNADFTAAMGMAEEIRQAMLGIKFTPRYLSDSQYKALESGSHYQLSARFVPEVPGAAQDTLWRNAPSLRLADGLVRRATLEGSLDRARGQTVAWWRVESDVPSRNIQLLMPKGDGDCFWTWVETPESRVRYLRILLHSPGTRYRMNLNLIGATKGEELTLYDGPVGVPIKAPF